ncbi:hypothetical protein Bhyg_04544 [Pseudolycoriella hygida]|uniref:Uncharacterized protein n=1 Tax=Pseudolycoriella hygida TaxID=35572 RepID=A0A9Q0SA48_9DIPT|nr:hypothetical protein Bhyg_04544 [Pseudolycoriella hygida]
MYNNQGNVFFGRDISSPQSPVNSAIPIHNHTCQGRHFHIQRNGMPQTFDSQGRLLQQPMPQYFGHPAGYMPRNEMPQQFSSPAGHWPQQFGSPAGSPQWSRSEMPQNVHQCPMQVNGIPQAADIQDSAQQPAMPTNEEQRRRLDSTGEDDNDSSSESDNESLYPPSTCSRTSSRDSETSSLLNSSFDFEEHNHFMAARERLEEFPGRVPPKKNKVIKVKTEDAAPEETEKKNKSKEQRFVWTVMTAVLLALGYISSR